MCSGHCFHTHQAVPRYPITVAPANSIMTTKKSMNALQKSEQKLKEKLGTLTVKKNEELKSTATKQKLKNLEKRESLKNETKTLKKSKKSADKKISKKSKKDLMRRAKFYSQQRPTIGNVEMTSNVNSIGVEKGHIPASLKKTDKIENPKKKEKKIKNQLAKREVFENSKFEISNYHSTRLTISATHTPLEVKLEKKNDVILPNLIPNVVAEKKWKNMPEKEDEDDTLFNIDPIMPDMDLPSLHLNNKTE